jgi:phosphomannomutase
MTDYSKFFKAYDIRGTVPELTSELYYWTGYGLVTEVLKPEGLSLNVNITHDARYSSPEFYKALYWGIRDAGGDPEALGLGSTDILYAACQLTNNPGVSLTASHNPKDDNGAKILKTGSTMLGINEGLALVRDFVIGKMGTQTIDLDNRPGVVENGILRTKVLEYFESKVKQIGSISEVENLLSTSGRKLRIAVDAGNGMGGLVMEHISKLYKNIEFTPLYWDLDGTFPNHPSDPQDISNLVDLQKTVRDNNLDFGFAFDGDADRVFFVDQNGDIINGDFLCAFFAKTLLEDYRKSPSEIFNPAVVYLQPGSRCVLDAIAESDGIAVPSMQGHTFIKAQMQKYKAIYGGEFSGHHYFADFGYLDSGAMAAVLFIKILVIQNKKVSDVFTKLNDNYYISELMNLTIPAGENFQDWKTKIKSKFSDASAISEFDGISVFYPDWKFSMRASNTEPKVRFILESKGNNQTEAKVALVKQVIGQ